MAAAFVGHASSDPPPEDIIMTAFGGMDMLWGAATAAAQVEGAWDADGKQPSIWDDFCKSIPAKTGDTSPGVLPHKCGHGKFISNLDVTDDFYHKYDQDIDMLADLGFTSMRVSISWPRVMPLVDGKHRANEAGLDFYRRVFAKMKTRDIVPMVTLFHWDLPNDLSWLEDSVVPAYMDFADLAFKTFPEVKHWATFNEPASFCNLGYSIGAFAPGHKSKLDHIMCTHHVLQAHAHAVKLYRDQYQKASGGQIGIVLDYKWSYPVNDLAESQQAAELDREFVFGIWAEPIFLTGDYPLGVKMFFGHHLPAFTEEEQRLLKGSADFYGANTYGGKVAMWTNHTFDDLKDGDNVAEMFSWSPCDPAAPATAKAMVKDPAFECGADSSWLWAKPEALSEYLRYINDRYHPGTIYLTEFGCDVKNESSLPMAQALIDPFRQEYYTLFLQEAARAKLSGVPLKGVYAWSLMDNLEWSDGLAYRFGIVYVDFNSKNLTRTPKSSSKWWSSLMEKMHAGRQITV